MQLEKYQEDEDVYEEEYEEEYEDFYNEDSFQSQSPEDEKRSR